MCAVIRMPAVTVVYSQKDSLKISFIIHSIYFYIKILTHPIVSINYGNQLITFHLIKWQLIKRYHSGA